jgi:hypothetical protein
MGIRGTPEQQLIFLNTHWGRRYDFTAPASPGGTWVATDKFGDHQRLDAASAWELLEAVRNHYQRNYRLPDARRDVADGGSWSG